MVITCVHAAHGINSYGQLLRSGWEVKGNGYVAPNNTHRHPDSSKRLKSHITEVSGQGCLSGSSEMASKEWRRAWPGKEFTGVGEWGRGKSSAHRQGIFWLESPACSRGETTQAFSLAYLAGSTRGGGGGRRGRWGLSRQHSNTQKYKAWLPITRTNISKNM